MFVVTTVRSEISLTLSRKTIDQNNNFSPQRLGYGLWIGLDMDSESVPSGGFHMNVSPPHTHTYAYIRAANSYVHVRVNNMFSYRG